MTEEFIKNCMLYEDGIVNSNDSLADSSYDKIKIFLVSLSDQQRIEHLSELCSHECESVKMWASTYLLEVNEALAISTIEQLIATESLIGLIADTVKDQWKDKTINLHE